MQAGVHGTDEEGGGSGIKRPGLSLFNSLLFHPVLTTAHVIWPRSIKRMTVIIHSLADAALADGPHRHPLTRSPSSVNLPPISTLIPARASRSSPPKLSSRDLTLLSPPSVKGWSSVTFSSNDTTAPLMLPGSHTVHRPIEVSNTFA